jgi:hypothetical protein
MLKYDDSPKSVEERAEAQIRAVLSPVPFIRVENAQRESHPHQQWDLIFHLTVRGRPHTLICEVKQSGQPRQIRSAILQLKSYHPLPAPKTTGLIVAPYLSPEARSICLDSEVGYVDFAGNCQIAFDGVFIQKSEAAKPPAAKRELKSLFSAKSARVLRLLLREPRRHWRVVDLAKATKVSLGHISSVRGALLAHEWAVADSEGLRLSKPAALLDQWREAYRPVSGRQLTFHTVLHGKGLDERVRVALAKAEGKGSVMLASFSSAQWLAAYARTSTLHLYADERRLNSLVDELKLSPSPRGGNVNIAVPKDAGLFLDSFEPSPGIVCSSPVQTYLDLCVSGERGREAADHLRSELLSWPE